jgi:hypothetical protein
MRKIEKTYNQFVSSIESTPRLMENEKTEREKSEL